MIQMELSCCDYRHKKCISYDLHRGKGQRSFLRFLWVTNTKDEDPDIIFYRFKSVVFGLCGSSFLLNGTLQCGKETLYSLFTSSGQKFVNIILFTEV